MLENSKQLAKLLIRGQTRLIKVSLIALPLILLFIFYGFFTTQNLVVAFEKQLHKSYFGLFGDLQIASQPALLEAIYRAPEFVHLERSFRINTKSVFLFEGELQKVLKGVEVIGYEDDYFKTKFASHKSNHLILSSVAFNQLGGDQNKVLSIFNPLNKKSLEVAHQTVLDFGFLSSNPIIVMSMTDLQRLYVNPLFFNQIEFNGLNSDEIQFIETVSNRLLRQGLATDYQLINPKKLTQEAREIFGTVNLFKNAFFILMALISLSIYFLAIKLLLNSKAESLKIIEYLGISRYEIGFNLVLLILVSCFICLILGQQLAFLSNDAITDFVGIQI